MYLIYFIALFLFAPFGFAEHVIVNNEDLVRGVDEFVSSRIAALQDCRPHSKVGGSLPLPVPLQMSRTDNDDGSSRPIGKSPHERGESFARTNL